MADLYADENFHYRVVELLRSLGHDVLTVQEANERRGDGARVLAFATQNNRAVLTLNRRHFARLHMQSSIHGGIIVCTRDDPLLLANRIDLAVTACPTLANQLLRINKPPKPPVAGGSPP